jgi:hypothetical protein
MLNYSFDAVANIVERTVEGHVAVKMAAAAVTRAFLLTARC